MSGLVGEQIFKFADEHRVVNHMVHRMLHHLGNFFYPVHTKVIYCYGEYQKEFNELFPYLQLVEGFPNDVGKLTLEHDNSLLLLYDLMSQCSNDQGVPDVFMCGSIHKGISVLYLTQNLFPSGKLSCTISLNSHSDLSKSTRLFGDYNLGKTNVS